MYEWHFTIAGAPDSEFAGGLYHGRILLPPDYPFKPPNIIFLTKSGRFDIHTKVCLSFSAFHPELWQPAWGIRLILEALIAFLPTPADGAIGSLNYTIIERQILAKQSVDYYCPVCQKKCSEMLLPTTLLCPPANDDDATAAAASSSSAFAKEIEALKLLQQQQHATTTTTEKENVEEDVAVMATATTSAPFDETMTNDGSAFAPNNNLPGYNDDTEPAAVVGPPAAGIVDSAPEMPVAPVLEPLAAVTPPRAATIPAATLLPPPPLPLSTTTTTLDPYLHAAILLLSVIVGLLLRKIQLLVEDLNALDDNHHSNN
jgi:ubiquitin-conjugating enzyme E2 J1